ncbi:class I SAM-dependent methyltransferase [Mycolicibacterium grossiae]|uniref:Class I SAM-dependent methyltransferase n=2 Tax=Mycolicibacterium grossiae TaxID=1552759 RepID=A0A1E8QAH9_9MYCO|nr:class I SAM-dependent methyltransferase [Mycolicibacterium grossiae]OFJ55416.1 hypothetical protein BEL07_01810 [Mycolicibacterium grossiae]QEM47010.1 class I SAM-dependent methyltransferase [Mycolicibacterium grossiae]
MGVTDAVTKFDVYRGMGRWFVNGFMDRHVLTMVAIIDSVQRERGVRGGVAEIGVHQGKFFIGLHLLQRRSEKSVAIDVFDDQELNIDKSGRGNLRRFRRNLRVWSSEGEVVIKKGDSTKLTPEALGELADGRIRLFSVDGGHTEDIVLSDMRLADAVLAEGGVVVADDVFNQAWPGVAGGTMRYLDGDANLVPFAVGFNKVLFTQPEHVESYQGALVAQFEDRPWRLTHKRSTFAGHSVVVLGPRSVGDLLFRNEQAEDFWRDTYRSVVDGARRRRQSLVAGGTHTGSGH